MTSNSDGDTQKLPVGDDVVQSDVTSSVPIDAITSYMTIGKAPLPPQLRGIFWLTDQGDQSALMSFGGPSGHPEYNTGSIDEDGSLIIKLNGFRNWTFADADSFKKYRPKDITYHFEFDNAEDPTFAQIELEIAGCGLTVNKNCLNFNMELSSGDDEYPDSVVWDRNSYLCCWPCAYKYKVVQVIDEHGKKIQSAWDAFVEYEERYASPPGTLTFAAALDAE